MKNISRIALIATFGFVSIAHAQREAPSREDRRAARREQVGQMSDEQRQQYFQQRMAARMQNMTPEQRAQWQERMQQGQQNGGGQNWGGQNGDAAGADGQGDPQQGAATAKANQMRAAMIAAGITETPVQDDIIAFILQQEKVRASLLQVAQTAAQALIKPTVPEGTPPVVETAAVEGQPAAPAAIDIKVANAEVERTIGDYESALETEKDRYATDLKDLDQKVSYSTTPRIKSFLSLIGVLNFESYALGGPSVIFAAAAPQRGGRNRGGAQGQNGGGQGQFGGGNQGGGGQGQFGGGNQGRFGGPQTGEAVPMQPAMN